MKMELHEILRLTQDRLSDGNSKSIEFDLTDFDSDKDTGICCIKECEGDIALSEYSVLQAVIEGFLKKSEEDKGVYDNKEHWSVFAEMFSSKVDLNADSAEVPAVKGVPFSTCRIIAATFRAYQKMSQILSEAGFCQRDTPGDFRNFTNEQRTKMAEIYVELRSTLDYYKSLFGLYGNPGRMSKVAGDTFYPTRDYSVDPQEDPTLSDSIILSSNGTWKKRRHRLEQYVNKQIGLKRSYLSPLSANTIIGNFKANISQFCPGDFDESIKHSRCLCDVLALALSFMLLSNKFSDSDDRLSGTEKSLPTLHTRLEAIWEIIKPTLPLIREIRLLEEPDPDYEPVGRRRERLISKEDPKGWVRWPTLNTAMPITCERSFVKWETA